MKKWTVRFASLLAYNVIVLLLIGWLTVARVGWSALWGGIVLTLLVLFVKPLATKMFQGYAARSAGSRTRIGQKLVEFLLAFVVALIVWLGVVLLSGVAAGGFWGYIVPPLLLLVGFIVYDLIDDRVEAHAGALYDRATGSSAAVSPAPPSAASREGSAELKDGLTAEQRRMLDDLGKS